MAHACTILDVSNIQPLSHLLLGVWDFSQQVDQSLPPAGAVQAETFLPLKLISLLQNPSLINLFIHSCAANICHGINTVWGLSSLSRIK